MDATRAMRNLLRLVTGISVVVGGLVLAPTSVFASGVIGTGTSASCTQAALTAAIVSGGSFTFNCGSSPVTIPIRSPLTIALNTTIDGGNLVTLDGGGQSYFFYVNNFQGVNFTVENMTFSNGLSSQEGGAIHAHYKSNLTVIHCTFTKNTTTSTAKQFDGGGGAIFVGSQASATITNSTFANNSGANGGAIYSLNSTLSVSGSTFNSNQATMTAPKSGSGGAIWNDTGALTVTNSTFNNNSALFQGGALAVSPDNVHPTGNFVVTNSIFTSNSAYYQGNGNGGAIFNQQPLTLTGSTFSGNTARNGAGLWLGANSTLSNDTIASNNALSPDGQHGMGGGLNITGGTISLINVTIAGNYADFLGGGVFGAANGTVKNTIIANNVAHNGGNNWNIQNQCSTGQANGGHNLDYPKDDCNFGSSAVKSPLLGSLANNGGPTQTMALLPGSPAIGSGDTTACRNTPVNNVDQRGFARKAACDLGAFETNNTSSSTEPDTFGVYRGSSGLFLLRDSNTSGYADFAFNYQYGNVPYPLVGDWTAAGTDTIGLLDESNADFLLRNSNSAGTPDEQYVLGNQGDEPISGQWSASAGHDGTGVFRPSNGLLLFRNSLSTGYADYVMILGIPGDRGLAGDWSGQGFDSPGVYRASNQMFLLTSTVCANCSVFADYAAQLGNPGDTPVTGDWVGQGHAGVGVFRPTNGLILLKNQIATGFADIVIVYGIPNDVPLAGHWTANVSAVANHAPNVLVGPTAAPNSTPMPNISNLGG